jgi:hypothetical protein
MPSVRRLAQPARVTALIITVALIVAVIGARPYAGSWNDGSRLAAVESLLERGTLAIDDSVFVRPRAVDRRHPPYPADVPGLFDKGTQDKLFIDGHFHSDKPPVVSGVLAAHYAPGYWLGVLPSPAERPDLFAWILTLLTAVPAFAVALFCMHRLGRLVGLDGWTHTVWVGAFALSTFALAYTRHVNSHILQLGVAAAWCLLAVGLARDEAEGRRRWGLLVAMGLLLGFGYNLDLGSGPLFFAFAVVLVLVRTRRILPTLIVVLAASPWLVACHGLNLAIGGVVGPLNAVPAYFDWPDCPFGTKNMTGLLRHPPLKLVVYALALLFGKHGLCVHNLPLLLCLPAALAVLPRRSPYRLELLAALGWCGAAWLMYAMLSNNYGGACCSVRWFVPFLAPGFFLLAVYLKQQPRRLRDLTVLAGWGAVLGLVMWLGGPWTLRMVPGLWPIAACASVTWLLVWVSSHRSADVAVALRVDGAAPWRAGWKASA